MKYYIRQIKPYIQPPQLQGFNDRPFPVKGYDWVQEDLEGALRDQIVVSDPWSKLIFKKRIVEASDVAKVVHGHWINISPYTASNGNYNKGQECSVCHAFFVSPGNTPYSNHPYCCKCGSKMGGEK